TNSSIRDYVGAFEFDFRFLRTIDAFLGQAELILTVRPGGEFGTDFTKGGYQVAMNFKVDKVDLTPSFYIQYYHGYAESLINFEERVNIFRARIMFYTFLTHSIISFSNSLGLPTLFLSSGPHR